MSNKRDRHTRLLAEALHGDWTGGPISNFARQAAVHARRNRAWRKTILVGGMTAILAVAFVLSQHRPVAIPPARIAPSPAPAYEVISDEDLIAGVRDRPVLVLPQRNGTKKIVLLGDETRS